MALPININELLKGQVVEWERIEFKKGWNPLEILQSTCAFANDFNNWGGGYIILGFESKDGQPIEPPIGVPISEIDNIQKDLINLCNKLRPHYFPIVEPVEYQGKMIIIIWIPGGSNRPYQAPNSLTTPANYRHYIRRYSCTKVTDIQEERDLVQLSAQVPYDDQINHNADISDLNVLLIQNYLKEVGSALANKINDISLKELCRRMNIADGPDEYLKPKNVGLLFFNDNPTKFFPGAGIDFVEFRNEVGDSYRERLFHGPIHQQLRDALSYIKNILVVESVKKIPGKAEAIRYYNYPFEAIEEALVNTLYHRGYQENSPVEVRIYPDKIEMVSYPGPLPPLNKEKLLTGKIVARRYRNRRIGDFLKELHLTEGRGTGIPKIKQALQQNGSPPPIFDTDDDLSYFLTQIPCHPDFVHVVDSLQDGLQDTLQDGLQDIQQEIKILNYCLRPKKKAEILRKLGLFVCHENYQRKVKPLIDKGYLVPTVPDKPTSRYQQYKTTDIGEKFLEQNIRE